MGLRMCRRGLCSDGSLPETVCRGSPLGGAKMTLSLAIQARADRETQRNCNHSCPDSTIANNQSCCVVAASGTASRQLAAELQHLTLQPRIQATRTVHRKPRRRRRDAIGDVTAADLFERDTGERT